MDGYHDTRQRSRYLDLATLPRCTPDRSFGCFVFFCSACSVLLLLSVLLYFRKMRTISAVQVFLFGVLASTAAQGTDTYTQDESTKSFLSWFKDMGALAQGVTVGESADMGRGIFATKSVVQDDLVLSVPLTMCMCRKTALQDKSKRVRKAYNALRDDEDLVALFILREKAKGSNSRFEPYLSVLPKRVPLTMFFSDSELKALQSPKRVSEAKKRERQLKKRFKNVQPQLGALFKDIPEDKKLNKFEHYAWAVAIVGSRALSMMGTKYLVPFADMFNYAPHHEERAANNGAEFLRYHKVQNGKFNVYADRACRAGAQLVEDYGDNSNTLYINHHGFVVEENPFDCVDVQMPQVSREERMRHKLASRMKMNARRAHCLTPGQPLSKEVNDHMKMLAFPEDWVEKCLQVLGNDKAKPVPRSGYNACFEDVDDNVLARARRLFIDTLKSALKAYPTTYDEDKALLASSGKTSVGGLFNMELTYHEKIAIQYRSSQKRLLSLLIVEHGARSSASDNANDKKAGGQSRQITEEEELASDSKKAKAFNEWFEKFHAPVNKIQAAAVPGMRIGTITTEHVKAEEVYLAVPVESIMDSASARRCDKLGPMFEELLQKHPRGDAFHELLIHLIYERFVRGESSFWWPYLNVIPSLPEMHAPAVAWTESELDELKGSEIFGALKAYKDKIRRKFQGVKKHLFSEYSHYLPPDTYNYDNYRWAHAILDSRRIWWNGEGHLTPMLDLINCMEGPDPSRVHSTRLDRRSENAITKAPWEFKKGEQLFEPYGQANHIYVMYHGFLLDQNSHDCVQIQLQVNPDDPDFDEKKKQLSRQRISRSSTLEACVAVGNVREEIYSFLGVSHGVKDRQQKYRLLLQELKTKLKLYPTTLEEDERLLDSGKTSDGEPMNYHYRTAVRFRKSEKQLLGELIEYLKGKTPTRKEEL